MFPDFCCFYHFFYHNIEPKCKLYQNLWNVLLTLLLQNVQTAAAVVWDCKWCWKLAIAYREGGRCRLQFLLPSCLADSGKRSWRSREVRRISPKASSPRLVLASCWLAAAARCSRPRMCSWRRCCSLCHRIPHLLAITLVRITSKAFIKIQYCIWEVRSTNFRYL